MYEFKSNTYTKLAKILRDAAAPEDMMVAFKEREQQGIDKYGMHVDAASHQNWARHAWEEAVDLMVYLKKYSEVNNVRNWMFFVHATLATFTCFIWEAMQKDEI